jgi:glyoxylase-like metal-dependent hydrolase (beta-lactamase superfamily II)
MLTNGRINGFYDFYKKECVHAPADILLYDGNIIPLGEESVKAMHTPGHSPGSLCYVCNDGKNDFIITGDTLFASSIGRCDLWMGNDTDMKASISLLSSFSPNTHIYPGHGPDCNLETALNAAKYYIDF